MAVRTIEEVNPQIVGWLESALEQWMGWKGQASIERDYYEGRQWSAEEAAKLERIGQPVITVNHIYPKVNMLVGLLMQQKPTIKCLPRGREDAEIASIATKVIRYIWDVNNVQAKLAEAFTDMATVGVGWLEVRSSSVLGKDPIVVEYVPWDEVIFDPDSRQPDFSDARFIFRGRWVDEDVFREFFPDAQDIDLSGNLGPSGLSSLVLDSGFRFYDSRRKRVYVLEVQWKKFEDTLCYWDGLEVVPYEPSVHDEAVRANKGMVMEARIPRVYQAIIVGNWVVREGPMPYIHNDFTLVPFVAMRDRYGQPMGIVRFLKDMQDEINKRRSKVLHYLTAKRVIAEEGAIANPDEFMEELMRPDAFLTYRKGYQVKIESDLQLGAQHFELMKEAANEMTAISGIYPDFMGMPTNARTAAAIRARVLQSQTAIQRFFSALERGLKRVAELCLAMARQFYTGPRLIQLTDEPEAILLNEPVPREDGTVEVRNSLAKLRADIVVQVRQGGVTERQEQLVQLVELMKALPPEMIAFNLDILIDAFDVPQKEEIKKRVRAYMALMAQQVQQQQNQNEGGGQ